MATLEKLVKAFEALKVFQPDGTVLDPKKKDQPVTKKDKVGNCNAIADCICSTNLRNGSDFPKFLGIAMETFLSFCDDSEPDVRIVADECLNRTIKTIMDTNLGRLQVELYKEIKKNGSQRSLRGALWRFSDMCHLIRPQKCRPYVVNLLPCIARICRRPEESIQDTLAQSMEKICPVLMGFTNDNEIKVLLKAFIPNLKSSSATARRTAASTVTLICQYSRKPTVFFSYLLTTLLDMVIPVGEVTENYLLLGVLLALRHLMPHLAADEVQHSALKGSFGQQKVKEKDVEVKIDTKQLVQVFELVLHYTSHEDHNVVTAALETLQQLLKTTPAPLINILTTKHSIPTSNLYGLAKQGRTESQSKIPSIADDLNLEDEFETGSEAASEKSESTGLGSSVPSETSELQGERDQNQDATDGVESGIHLNQDAGEGLELEPGGSYSSIDIGDIRDDNVLSPTSTETALIANKLSSPAEETNEKVGIPYGKLRKGVSDPKLITTDEMLTAEIDISGKKFSVQQSAVILGQYSSDVREGDIGELCDDDIPLVYCTRLLCSRFLLSGVPQGLISDRKVRVSSKALAIGCLAGTLAVCPRMFLYKVHKAVSSPGAIQDIKDVLLYTNHSDPQLKGNTAILIGNLIQASMLESRGRMDKWIKQFASKDYMKLEVLVNHLIAILEDVSAVAVRQALIALQCCLNSVLNSRNAEVGVKAVLSLLRLSSNPYWLVKVELVELLSDIDFRVLTFLEGLCTEVRRGNNHYVGMLNLQDKVINNVMLSLLADENHRVRHATASAIIRLVPKLFHATDNPQQDPIITMASDTSASYLEPIMYEWSQPLQPVVHGLVLPYNFNPIDLPSTTLESSLSRVLALICRKLNTSDSRHITNGCCHALAVLSEKYLTTMYPTAWSCLYIPTPLAGDGEGNSQHSGTHGGGIMSMVISLLTCSQGVALDIATHQDVLTLAGNIFAGASYACLGPGCSGEDGEDAHWAGLADRSLVQLADQLLVHVARLLNVCAHVIEEQPLGAIPARTSLPSLPVAPSLSPIKRRAKGLKDEVVSQTGQATADKPQNKDIPKESEKVEKGKKESLGSFYSHPQYVKLYEVLKSVYASYKISLDISNSEKFAGLLKAALTTLAQLLEIAGLADVGKQAEELLGYLKSAASIEPTTTVLCVQQLLKALFGTNLSSQWECGTGQSVGNKQGKMGRLTLNMRPGLYHCCFTTPYTQFTQCLASATFRAATHIEQDDGSWMGWVKKRAERKVPTVLKPGSKVDKATIANYIRLFEPLVIKALKQYTMTSNLELQRQVLNLLIQLVQLRVNYCLLDSDQIFIGFVIKQFEFIEEGQIRNSEIFVPDIFNFLVLLSYEKYHSKSIIGFPKIIQLCDGIMASGQDPTTHAIPALQAIVQDLFVVRANNKSDVNKEIDTQREVVISMLLRLIQHYQILEMIILVLHQSHKEGEDKWKRLSRQVTDMVLNILSRQQLNTDSQMGIDVVHRLFEVVAASVFRPVDILLKTLFSPPHNVSTLVGLQRWLALVLVILRVLICQSKEETVLSRLKELDLSVYLSKDLVSRHKQGQAADYYSVQDMNLLNRQGLSAVEIFARFLFQVVGIVAQELKEQTTCLPRVNGKETFLCQELAHLLLYIMHMFQSGIFRKVASTATGLLHKEAPEGFFNITEINSCFNSLVTSNPTLTLQWSNVLILLNYDCQNYWSDLLLTNKRYMHARPRCNHTDSVDVLLAKTKSCSEEVARRGGLILYCDFVCENLNDAEKMTWVIINHVNDLMLLSSEPPVQDFIGAIHRNSAASSLLIQAIHSRCEHISQPVLIKQMLECLESVHTSQSGPLLVLLVDKFLNTHNLAVARLCDKIACKHVEMLLAEQIEISKQQLPLHDLNKILEDMHIHLLHQKHERLVTLLKKLRDSFIVAINTTSSKPGGAKQIVGNETKVQSVLAVIDPSSHKIDKEFFTSFTKEECCHSSSPAQECVLLLQKLDYAEMLNIVSDKEFNLSLLRECISLGLSESLLRQQQSSSESDISSVATNTKPAEFLSDLFKASQVALLKNMNSVVNTLPVPHHVMNYSHNVSHEEVEYSEKMEDLLGDVAWFECIFPLVNAMLEFMRSLRILAWDVELAEQSVRDITRFSVLASEVCYWMIQQGQFPTVRQLKILFDFLSVVLENHETVAVISQKDHVTWVCSIVRTVHQIMCSLVKLPGEKLVKLPHQESQDDSPAAGFDEMHYAVKACDEISELVECLKGHLNLYRLHPSIPTFLARPMVNTVIGLARLPLVNSYARTPPLVWKMGWMPSPSGDLKTCLPPLPLDYLQEKDVLKDFIVRVNILGWTSRQQFEETWMGLLGVLNPVQREGEKMVNIEEDIDRTQCQVEATRGITALLIQTLYTPVSGNPSHGKLDYRPRTKELAFLHTRVGKKLARIRGIIESELQSVITNSPGTACNQGWHLRTWESEPQKYMFVSNLEREFQDDKFNLGQLSVHSTWGLLGMLEHQNIASSSESDSASETPTVSPESSQKILPPVHKASYADTVKRSFAASGLDMFSCLQFLLDLYGQLLAPTDNARTPLMQLNETMKSVVALSDIFTDKSQFEWMLSTLLEVYRVHHMEDEISMQYLTVGICKAAAVVGMDIAKCERVVKIIETHIRSTHLPTKISVLHGVLYLLEAGMTEVVQVILPLITDYLFKTLSSITVTTILSQQHVMVMWACILYICENYLEHLNESDFQPRVIQVCLSTLSGGEDLTSLPVYLAIMKGLERLVLSDVVSKTDMDAVVKLAVERLNSPCAVRSLAALGLLLTSMYSGKQNDQWTPTALLDEPDFVGTQVSNDPESLIIAMERVNVLFDRIRKGCPYEACVMTTVLPLFLTDFFPPQDIMNKVIGEFLSSQQPHPRLLANVVFKVFEQLIARRQQHVVQDWVMLSLSNFTQRNPVAMAVWSLSCFFTSASSNPWLRAFLPHLLSRMGKLEPTDQRLFSLSALDFYTHLTDANTQRTFRSTFQSVSNVTHVYAEIASLCDKIGL